LTFKSFLVTGILIGFCFGVIYAIKMTYKEIDKDSYNPSHMKIMQWISTGFIIIINHLLQYVLKDLTEKEMHENATKLNISIALKLTIARFINSSLIMVTLNSTPESWFTGPSLAYEASSLAFALAFYVPFMELLNIPYLSK
jgi:ABC-type methionine transport system permease subunit